MIAVRNRIIIKDILTIQNLISFFRILLIAMIIWLYCVRTSRYAVVLVISAAAFTDIIDGAYAHSFKPASDLSKMIAAITGTLTQATLIICLIPRYHWMGALLLLLLVQKAMELTTGPLIIKSADPVRRAKWYEKAGGMTLYVTTIILVLFEGMSETLAAIFIVACGLVMATALIFYVRDFKKAVASVSAGRESCYAFLQLWKWMLLFIWLGIILAFFICRKEISVEEILRFTPENPFLAAIVMLALFALKSISIVIYSGILFAASGIMFPLPAAILLNISGAVIMESIPYAIGKKLGAKAVNRIAEKYPKAETLRKFRSENDFFFSFFVRLIGFLPGDIISLYMGAVHVPYPKYLLGSILGSLPRLIAITVIGMSITKIRSQQFRIAVCAEVLIIILSLGIFTIYKKKHQHSE